MGTASTMACILAALGLMPLRGATAAAVSSLRLRLAEETGAIAISLAQRRTKPQSLLTRESFLNAITVVQAIGGSSNAIVHLMAIIGRHPAVAGKITLDTIDEVGRRTPLLVDLKPSGENYMTDFHNSGGMVALLHELKPLLHLEAMTVSGLTLGEELIRQPAFTMPADGKAVSCIRPLRAPLFSASSLVVLRGNLAPGGAVVKASASADSGLLRHRGPALVFAGAADLAARIDDPALVVTRDSVLVLQNIGPVGHPGMPEAGLIPIPRKLAAAGVIDMLRISDGRMSGTAGGTIVLHITPEAADPTSALGVVKDGDIIECDIDRRLLQLHVEEEELHRRISERQQYSQENGQTDTDPAGGNWLTRRNMRGYRGLYMREVQQAEHGADFRFLTAAGPP